VFSDLDRAVRGRLRTLSKDNADGVGRHLVMVGRLLDTQPELAYEHAQAAVRRAGRVDVVREAAGLAAYRTGRYAEALRELRTVRRLNGSSEHLAIMADCERGLGRPERALTLAQEPEAETLDADAKVELAMVVSGARLDLGQAEAAVAALSSPVVRAATGLVAVRVAQARATALEAAGRTDEAAAELARYTQDQLDEAAGDVEIEDEVVSFDLSVFDEDGEYDEEVPEPGADDADTAAEDDEAVADDESADDDDDESDDESADDDDDESDGDADEVVTVDVDAVDGAAGSAVSESGDEAEGSR
jgi:tetratricopeptide (TPR) repeat protein